MWTQTFNNDVAVKLELYLPCKQNVVEWSDRVHCSKALHLVVIQQYQQRATPLGDAQLWDSGESATASRSHNHLRVVRELLEGMIVTNEIKCWETCMNKLTAKHLAPSNFRNFEAADNWILVWNGLCFGCDVCIVLWSAKSVYLKLLVSLHVECYFILNKAEEM